MTITDDVPSTAAFAPEFPTRGRWIGRSAELAPDPTGRVGEPVLGRSITIDRDVAHAELLVCGLGLQHVTIDGTPVDDHRLDPAFSNVDRTVYYVRTDVSERLPVGDHDLEISLGRGFYALPTENVWHWQSPPWQAPLQAVAELHLQYADGGRAVISTDDTWQTWTGRTTYDCYYAGESYDATLVPGSRRPAVIMDGPRGRLVEQRHPPIRVTWSGSPTWTRIGDSWVGDVGRTLAGWVSLRTRQEAGATVMITYAEAAEPDGRLAPRNQHVTGDRFQVDTYTGNGEPDQVWEPRSTYKGFRYVQLDGLTHEPDATTVTAHLAHNDVRTVGTFRCSDPLLEGYADAMGRTILNNLHHFPTDTPMYEKNGWTGDAQLGADTMVELFDLHLLLAKWVQDLQDAQREDGSLPVIVPTAGWGYADLAPSPEWTTVYPHLLQLLHRWYGDRDLLVRHWDSLVAYLDWELGKLVDGCAISQLGDYLQPGTPGNGPDDSGVTASSLLVRGLRAGARIGHELGEAVEAERLERAADDLTAAMNDRYLRGGRYVVGEQYSQTSNALPLVLGLVPAEAVADVVASLVADVRERGDHHNVGCIGAATLLPALTRHGHADLALRVARQTSYPGWGYWFAHGADTMWEMWELTARSRNHYFHGTVTQWLIEDVAGLRCGEDGWRTFTVAPAVFDGLDHASYAVETVRGRAAVSWVREGSAVTLEVEVPTGSTATVLLPGAEASTLDAGEHRLEHVIDRAGQS